MLKFSGTEDLVIALEGTSVKSADGDDGTAELLCLNSAPRAIGCRDMDDAGRRREAQMPRARGVVRCSRLRRYFCRVRVIGEAAAGREMVLFTGDVPKCETHAAFARDDQSGRELDVKVNMTSVQYRDQK
jgi:hypothetical protein